jgi:hypothetical protein
MAIFKLEQIRAQPGYRLRLEYADGVEGEVDLSDLVSRGVFERLTDPDTFGTVYVTECGDVAWGEDLELCADTLYMKLTGQTPEEVFPGLRETASRA